MSEARVAGSLTDDEARSVYVELVKVAERDLTGDALVSRLAEIRAMAEARGWDLAPEDPRSAAQVEFDGMFRDRVEIYGHTVGQPWQSAGPGGYPAVVTPGDLAIYRAAPADGEPPDADDLRVVESWLSRSAAPDKAAELLGLAKSNGLVLRALHTYAAVAQHYREARPK
jgi:hypothetical protein